MARTKVISKSYVDSFVDALGNECSVGDSVIYNRSGELARGFVTRICKVHKANAYTSSYTSYTVTVESHDGNGGVSKVKNIKCIAALKYLIHAN